MVDWPWFARSDSERARSDGGTAVDRDHTGESVQRLERELERVRGERDEAQEERDRLRDALEEEREQRDALRGAIDDLTAVVKANADGNLTVSPGETEVEAVAELYATHRALVEEWRDTVETVATFGEQVTTSTERVDDRIDSVKAASREVSDAVEDISAGAREQNERINGISDETEAVSATIEEIAASADEVATTTGDATAVGDEARAAATEARTELERLSDRSAETVDTIERLNDRLTEIEEIAESISDIADQTNILALNANIEAARSDGGDGFGVVAREVKELAGETKEATAEIDASTDRVHEQASTAVEAVHETSESVGATRDTVDDVIDSLERVAGEVEEIDASVREIDEATDTQARSTQEIVSMVNAVGEISDQTAEEAATAAAAAQSQTTELAEVSSHVSTLSERAAALESAIDDYRVTSDSAAEDETTVEFWHAMGGEKALLIETLAREYEESVEGVTIEPSSKGSYRGTLEAAIDAAQRDSPPAITQVFEIGSSRARESDQFTPVEQLLPREHVDALLDPVANYYRFDGTLHSLPFNASNPLLAINREAFERAGLDPDSPPETLDAVREASERLVDSGGVEYGTTFANYSWFVEQWFAEADEPLVDRENGRAGAPTTSNLDGDVGRSLFEWWMDMAEQGYHHDPGIEARGAARSAFHEGEAAMLVGSSSSLTAIESGADFAIETGRFPVLDARTGVLVGGGSLWIGADLSPAVREAASEFLTWLTRPEQQARWHRETGYFPVHEGALPELRSDDWFEENPHYATALDQLVETRDTVATRGAQIGPFDTVRTIIEDGVERMYTADSVGDTLRAIDDQIAATLDDDR